MTERVLIGLSGGINSMAVLCWLSEQEDKPKEVHLFYAHFIEHSPDTFQFVADGIRYARKNFDSVKVKVTKNSILDYFRSENIIPHPTNSPCSKKLKIEPMNQYAYENDIFIDLVGYVKHELKRRGERQKKQLDKEPLSLFGNLQKLYPIGEFTDEWCFEIVDRCIGWHPAIYDIRWTKEDFDEGLCSEKEIGQRVFKHNNCLPCKNMYPKDIKAVRKYFPELHFKAMKLSAEISRYWGRNEAEFYSTFGRDLGQDSTCEVCKF